MARRWRRFGHDRLYVTGPAGEQVGWADLTSGELHPISPMHLFALSRTVADWQAWSHGALSAPPALSLTWSPLVQPGPGVAPSPTTTVPGAAQPARRTLATGHAPSPPVLPPSWVDLAANQPGAAARAKARALRDAAPVRTFFARLVNLRTPERAWRIGADGEELVAADLSQLVRFDTRWRVIHAVPVGATGADIDHLVIGPGGVFTLNTKHHPDGTLWVGGDTFLVNGHRQSYVRNSRHEADRAARLLTAASGLRLRVAGVIVPVDARRLVIKSEPADVAVVPRKCLTAWLLNSRQVLDDRTIAVVAEAARRSTTWRSS